MRERFGFTPSVPFEEGIRRFRDFFLREQRGAGQSA
jgi:nucleoside-diphosphate-sugar epimerase